MDAQNQHEFSYASGIGWYCTSHQWCNEGPDTVPAKRHGQCTCYCHVWAGVKHMAACCSPEPFSETP